MVAGIPGTDKHKVSLLTADVLLGHHPADTLMILPDLQLAVHLAPHTHIAPHQFAAVVAEGSLQGRTGVNPAQTSLGFSKHCSFFCFQESAAFNLQ